MNAAPAYLDDAYVATAAAGLMLPRHVAADLYPRLPIGVDLFCGCGGFGLGFIQAGWEVIAGVEWDCAAAHTYMTNLCRYGEFQIHFIEDADGERFEKYLTKSMFGGKKKKKSRIEDVDVAGSGWLAIQPASVPGVSHFFLGDIRKLTGARLLETIGVERGDVDCVSGGPPCQGFSNSGKRNVMDPRNSLVFEFARMVLEIHPKTMVFENVPGIMSMVTPDGVPVVDALVRVLEDGDFATGDALRRSIAAQTGAVGLLRTKKRAPKPKEDEQADESLDDDTQRDMFEAAHV